VTQEPINEKGSIDVYSDDPIFGLFDLYLESFDELIPASESIDAYQYFDSGYVFDLYVKANKYLGEDLYALSSSTDNIGTRDVISDVVEGYNVFNPFENVSETFLSLPLTASSILANGGTAGTGLHDSDIIWQFIDGTVEGAWLRRSDMDSVNATPNIRINSGYTEFKFPYPYRGVMLNDIEWSGKGIDDVNITNYITLNDQLDADKINDLYWNDTSELSSATPISLYRTNLIDLGASPSKNINEADQILLKEFKDSNESEFAWLYDFESLELPINCGTNYIYYPLYSLQKRRTDFPFKIDADQAKPVELSTIPTSREMCGAVAGTDVSNSDWFIKKTSVCGSESEGAWLKGVNVSTINSKSRGGAIQVGINAIFPSGKSTPFMWHRDDILCDDAINGFDHDDYCDYHQINNFTSVVDPDPSQTPIGWEKCTCKAVYRSPIGNPLTDFETYFDFHDIIYEDVSDNELSLADWRDSEGHSYKTSKNFGIFRYNGASSGINEPDVGFGIGMWTTYDNKPFELKKGKTYYYRRAELGGCGDDTAPCLVVNNCICIEHCGEAFWTKMVKNENGDWVSAGVRSDMLLEAGQHYEYVKRGSINYEHEIEYSELDPSGIPVTLTKWVTRSTPQPSYNFNKKLYQTKPYWAESVNVHGLNVGVYPQNTEHPYMFNTQPMPSEMILRDDNYIRYNRQSCEPFNWEQPMNFTVNTTHPPEWKKIIIDHTSPILLQKILGCGACSLSFDIDPQPCKKSASMMDSSCTSYFTTIHATEETSDMVIRSSTNCKGITEIYYHAQAPFSWEETFNETVYSVVNTTTSSLFSVAKTPWRNLLNQNVSQIKINEEESTLKNDREVGLMSPSNIGVLKIEKFNIANTFKTPN